AAAPEARVAATPPPSTTLDSVTQLTPPRPTEWVLTLACVDGPGIVHAISGAIVAAGGNIEESQQFASADTGRFFMRLQVSAAGDDEAADFEQRFRGELAPVTERYAMT